MYTKSFLRREEYKKLSGLQIDGPILDVGGSKKSGYHELIQGDHTITVGNINESYGIDVVFDAQERWPFGESSFQGVLFMNVLEHLYHYDRAVEESFRVLKQGGVLVGVVPFMFNVHGSPSDYFRYTRFALERMLSEAGYEEVEVTELGTGAFSVIYHTLIGFMRPRFVAESAMRVARLLDGILLRIKPSHMMGTTNMPLGYYFEAKKPTARTYAD